LPAVFHIILRYIDDVELRMQIENLLNFSASPGIAMSHYVTLRKTTPHAFTSQEGQVYLVLLADFFRRFAASPSPRSSFPSGKTRHDPAIRKNGGPRSEYTPTPREPETGTCESVPPRL
jgi:hypothetical protein